MKVEITDVLNGKILGRAENGQEVEIEIQREGAEQVIREALAEADGVPIVFDIRLEGEAN